MDYKTETNHVKAVAKRNADAIREEHREIMKRIMTILEELKSTMKDLGLRVVEVETGIEYNGEQFLLVLNIEWRWAKIKHSVFWINGTKDVSEYVPVFDENDEARAVYRFIEQWDNASIPDKICRKMMKLLEEEREKASGRLERTKAAQKILRVTEIYRDGELVSRKEEAI